jgi:hypothetical protein
VTNRLDAVHNAGDLVNEYRHRLHCRTVGRLVAGLSRKLGAAFSGGAQIDDNAYRVERGRAPPGTAAGRPRHARTVPSL